MNTKLKNLLKDTGWFAIGNLGSKLIAFFLIPFYTNILTTKEYGIIDIITTTISIMIPIFTLSIQDGVFRFALDDNEDKSSVFSGCMSITLLSVVFVFPFIPLFKVIIPKFEDYVYYFIAIYFATALTGVMSYFTKGIGKNNIFAANGIITSISLSVLNILFLVIFKYGIYGYLLSMFFSNVVSFLFFTFVGKLGRYYSFSKIDKTQIKRILTYSIPLIPAAIAWLIMISIDKYMLLYMEGVERNGLYGVAHKIPSLISTFMALFINAWQITAVKTKDDEDSDRFTSRLYNALYILGFFMTFAVVILSEPIARILFAKDFYVAWMLTPCLTIATTLSAFSSFIGGVFTAHKRSDLHFKSNIIALISNIILNYILIKAIGFRGVSIATMISFFIVLVYRTIKVQKLATLSYDMKKFYISLTILMISSIVVTFDIGNYYFICGIGLIVSVILYHNEIVNLLHRVSSLIIKKNRR